HLQGPVSHRGQLRDLPRARGDGPHRVEEVARRRRRVRSGSDFRNCHGMSLRIVVTGSESTGKTTLAEQLARYYRAELVAEFVREYAAARHGVIEFSDHGPIARGQMELEDAAIARGNSMVVQDTDLLSTVVYCEHYFGKSPAWITEAARDRAP